MIPNFAVLGTLVSNIHHVLVGLFYAALPVAILLSVLFGYFQTGAPDYIDILKRAFIATLLLVSFPEVSNLILAVCNGVADKISGMSGLNEFLRLAAAKSHTYSASKSALLLKFDDLLIACLSYFSFILLYVARYLIIALYYFYWILLSALSPILILFYMFPQTSKITANLYRGLIEVASWKIIWAVESAMLTSLSLGDIYKTSGNYLTLIVLNFVIAAGMLCTPFLVRAIASDGAHATERALSPLITAGLVVLPQKLMRQNRPSQEQIQQNAINT